MTEMATRRRSSVSFQLHDNPLQLPQTATTHGPQVRITSSRIRRALPLPLLAFGLGMAAMVSQGRVDLTLMAFHLDTKKCTT